MNNTADLDLDKSNKLSIIEETLLTYKSIIKYQKDEILKIEAIIKQYTDHLDRQNKALKLYLEEEEELNRKKKAIIKDNENYQNVENIIMNEQKLSEESTDEVMIIETPTEIKTTNSKKIKKSVKQQTKNISTINITTINNETVYSISILDDNIFIGGSNGMLMKYNSKKTFIYETKTKEDILQIEIIKISGIISLYAFTKETVIVNKNIKEPQLHVYLNFSRINHVFKKECMLYITNKNGIIHRFNTNDDLIKDYKTNEYVTSIVINSATSKPSLAVFKNGLLYKFMVNKNSLSKFERIEGVENLKRVLQIVNLGYLYYSDTTIWIVDNNLNELKNEKFENGIKLVEVYVGSFVVVDHDDTLHIYELNNTHIMKLYTQRIQGDISAVTIAMKKVYLSVGNEIFIIKYN